MNLILKKILLITLTLFLVLSQSSIYVFAEEAAGGQEANEAEEAKPPKENKPPDAVTEAQEAQEAAPVEEATTEQTVEPTVQSIEESGDGNSSGNVGDTSLQTGDANSTGEVYNLGNTNAATEGSDSDSGNGIGVSVTNSDNGSDSQNTGSATVVNNNNTDQENSATVVNTFNQTAVSGNNDANKNVGSVAIVTGDANVSATSLTAANTNVAGVSVSEFNILDDHVGDYILDFATGCISGCDGGDIAIANTGNGANSDNLGEVYLENNNNIDQANYGTLTNNLDLYADTGHNDANKNTGGDVSITTGDANVAANLLTFLNNNIAGGVMFGVVNIFGNLIGDIILPDSAFDQIACGLCGQDINILNSGNGTGSDNNSLVNSSNINNINQANDANIANNLYLEAETGDNSASGNTGGNVGITTGNSTLDASILNIANMNLVGGNMWLVIINEAGNWVGKLYGSDQFGKLASSGNALFSIDPNGIINVTNSGNGADSTNNGVVNTSTNNNINQSNIANIENNLNLVANTGENDASKNTGGNVSILTGDAKVLANIVNYVNNNIVGGKLLVTFVNVFGSWTGDFLTPGSHKETSSVLAQGSASNQNNASPNNNSGGPNGSSSGSSGSESQGSSNPLNNLIAAAGFFGGSSSNSEGGTSVGIKVASINTGDLGLLTQGATDEKVNLNLAWAFVVLPLVGSALIIGNKLRKRYLIKSI